MLVRVDEAFADSTEFLEAAKGKVFTDEPVEKNTIDLFTLPDHHRGLRPAKKFQSRNILDTLQSTLKHPG